MPLSDPGIRNIIISLCTFIKNLAGLIKHVDPNAIYINPELDHAVVACGDARIFDNLNIEPQTGFNKTFDHARELRFMSPEWIEEVETGTTDPQKLIFESQLWWDLGIIIYELATSGCHPFYHDSPRVSYTLIRNFNPVFPRNLPKMVNERLQ